jgi:Chaperone of endosialidase/Domain of unknown function (DUF5011)
MTPLDGANEVIFFDDVRYISAREAARTLGVVRDYVARLCRQGKIRGRQVGKNWYAEVPSLQRWAIEQDHQRALRSDALSRERVEERRAAQSPAANRRNTTPTPYVDDRTVSAATSAASVASQVSRELHRKLESAVSRGSGDAVSRATALSARTSSQVPLYAVSPAFDLLHKMAAAVLAVTLVVGLYTVRNSLVATSPDLVPGTAVTPQVELGAAAGLVGNTLSNLVDAMQNGIAFLAALFEAPVASSDPEGAVVSLQIIGGGPSSSNAPAPASATSPAQSVTHTIIENNPIVERVIQSENVIASGGITESELDQKLQQLNNSLSEKIYSLTSANSTAIAQNYNVTAQTNAIDQLTNTTITNPAISGGSISGANISGATISGATFAGTTTLQALSVSGSATSTYAAGIEITSGCFAIGGTCISGSGGGTPGGASTQVQFNSGGSFAGASTFTFASSTSLLTVASASTTLFSAYGPTYFGSTGTSSFTPSGALTLAQPLVVSSGGTGTSTLPAYGQLLVGNASGGYSLLATSSLGISGGGGSSNVSTSSQNIWSALQVFAANASTSQFTATSSVWFTSLASALLAVDQNGKLIATSSIGTGYLTGSLGTINGTTLSVGDSITITAASSTLLANNNTFSGNNLFSASTTFSNVVNIQNASTSLVTFGTAWLSGIANALLATDNNGKIISTTTIGTNLLSANTISGVALGGTLSNLSAGSGLSGSAYNGSAPQTFSLNHASPNSWTGLQQFANASTTLTSAYGPAYFGATATSSFNSSGQLTLASLASAVLGVNASGQVVATSSIGTNLLSANTIAITNGGGLTVSGSPIALGGSGTISLDLAHQNNWTGLQTFANASSSNLSVFGNAYFGGSATSTFDSAGDLAVAGTLNVTGKSTLGNASTTVLSISGNSYLGTAQSTAFAINSILSCSGSQALQTDGSGNVSCGAISIGGATSGGGWTATSGAVNGTITESTSTYLVAVGATTTPYAKFTVLSGATGTTTLALVPAASQTANIIDIYSTSGSLGSVFTAAGSLGLGTTSPGSILSINGVGNFVSGATSTIYNGLALGNLTVTSTPYFTNIANALLATDQNGKVVSTTTIGTNLLSANTFALSDSNSTLTVGGSPATLGGTLTATLNLAHGNWWTATQNFTNASTSEFTATSSVWFTGVTASSLLAVDTNGKLVATSSIGTNLLTGSLGTINGTSLNAGSSITVTAASSTALSDNNTFSGTTTLSKVGNASSTLTTLNQNGGSTWFSGLASAVLGTDNNGKVVSTTTIGTNLLSANTISGVALGGTLANLNAGSGLTGSAYNGSGAQTFTLNLGNSNWWTAAQNFTNASTSQFTATSSVWFTSLASALLAVDNNGKLVATSSIGTNLLTGTLGTINGTNLNAGASITVTAASSTLLNDANTWAKLQNFTNASTSQFTATSSVYLTSLTNALLSTDNNGKIVATTSVGVNYLTGVLPIGNGGTNQASQTTNGVNYFDGTHITSSNLLAFLASGTLFVGTSTPSTSASLFVTASTSQSGSNLLLTVASSTGSSLFNINGNGAITQSGITNALVAADNTGKLIASTTIGTNLLSANTIALSDANSTLTIGGSPATLGGTLTATLNLAHGNWWAATQNFTNASTSQFTATSSVWFTSLASALLAVDNNGKLIATSSIGTNLLTGALGTINATTLNAGGSVTVTAASSTALSDNNSFSGTTTLNKVANASSTLTTLNQNSGSTWFSGLASALLGTDNNGKVVSTTTIGTNLLSANTISGVALGGNLFNLSHDSTLNGTSYNGSSAISNWGLNLANANNWTGLQQFSNSSSTLASVYSALYVGDTATTTIKGSATSTFGAGISATVLNVTSSSATSTFANGISLSSGCILSNGSCVGANSGTVSSGTQGQFAFYNTAGSTISGTSTIFVTQAGQVAIATTSPGLVSGANQYLTIASNGANTFPALELAGRTNTGGGSIGRIDFFNQSGSTLNARISTVIGNDTSFGRLVFSTDNSGTLSEAMRINENGNLLVGTTTLASAASFGVQNGASGNNIVAFYSSTGAPEASLSNSGTLTLNGPAASSLLALNSSNQVVATTTIGTNLLSANTISGVTLGNNLNSLSHDPTLNGSSYNGSASVSNWGLNLSNANNWTSLQQFTAASTTLFSSYGPAYFGGTATSSFSTTGALSLVSNGLNVGSGQLIVSGGNVGIGVSSGLNALVTAQGSSADEASNAGILALQTAASTHGLRMGILDSDHAWIQSFDSLPLYINPGGNNTILNATAGNVGIGTTSPSAILDVVGVTGGNDFLVRDTTPGHGGLVVKPQSSYVEVQGTNQQLTAVDILALNPEGGTVDIATTTSGFLGQGAQMNLAFVSNNGIGLGINDATPQTGGAYLQFRQNETVDGSISENGSATAFNTSSDRRIKENIATTTLGLDMLMQLPVRSFDFINDPTHATTTGFIAQELYNVFPWAVTTNGDNGVVALGPTSTPWQVDYGRVTPLIVKAVQDIADLSNTFKNTLITWLGDAQNGIKDLYATVIHANEVDTQKLCVNDSTGAKTCITKAQLDQLLENAASQQGGSGPSQSSSGNSSISSSVSGFPGASSSTPPVISVNGNDPATVQVGATYNDLGATITGPQADLNLGIRTFLNGVAMSPVQLDSSQAATDTIAYAATDQNGLISTSTRTVIVVAPQAANDNQASSTLPAANDNLQPLDATGTTATSAP